MTGDAHHPKTGKSPAGKSGRTPPPVIFCPYYLVFLILVILVIMLYILLISESNRGFLVADFVSICSWFNTFHKFLIFKEYMNINK
jgi:hypothetical protein